MPGTMLITANTDTVKRALPSRRLYSNVDTHTKKLKKGKERR